MPHQGNSLDTPLLNELLQPICAQPLTAIRRAVGQVFEFGLQKPASNKHGEPTTHGDFWLKFIWADWRVIHRGRVILGSSDQDEEGWFYDAEEPPLLEYNANARALAHSFLENVAAGKHIVESVGVGDFADVTIALSYDLLIQSFGSSGEDRDSWWFLNLLTDMSCLVGPSGHNLGRHEGLHCSNRQGNS